LPDAELSAAELRAGGRQWFPDIQPPPLDGPAGVGGHRGPTSSITSRIPNGTTLGSTETVSRELGLPEAVTPLPEWQLTSKTPSSTPRAPVVLVGANSCAGRVVPGVEAGGGFAALQAARRTPTSNRAEQRNPWRSQAASVVHADRHVIVLLLRASGAESLAVLDYAQTGCRSPRVMSDLAVSRSYVDRRRTRPPTHRGAEGARRNHGVSGAGDAPVPS